MYRTTACRPVTEAPRLEAATTGIKWQYYQGAGDKLRTLFYVNISFTFGYKIYKLSFNSEVSYAAEWQNKNVLHRFFRGCALYDMVHHWSHYLGGPHSTISTTTMGRTLLLVCHSCERIDAPHLSIVPNPMATQYKVWATTKIMVIGVIISRSRFLYKDDTQRWIKHIAAASRWSKTENWTQWQPLPKRSDP